MSAPICRCGHHKRRHNPTRNWCWACRSCTGFRPKPAEVYAEVYAEAYADVPVRGGTP